MKNQDITDTKDFGLVVVLCVSPFSERICLFQMFASGKDANLHLSGKAPLSFKWLC